MIRYNKIVWTRSRFILIYSCTRLWFKNGACQKTVGSYEGHKSLPEFFFSQKIIVVLEFWCLWSRRPADDRRSIGQHNYILPDETLLSIICKNKIKKQFFLRCKQPTRCNNFFAY